MVNGESVVVSGIAYVTVPTKTSDLVNDSDFIKSGNLSLVAFTGNYDDLENKPYIPTVPTKTSDLTNDSGFITNSVDDLVNYSLTGDFSEVAFTGDYDDLSDTPTIPTSMSDLMNDMGYITKDVDDLTYYTESRFYSTVATTGNYDDLYNKPTIPTTTSELTNDSGFITNTVNNLTNYTLSSNLATVATTGDYDDLIDKPSIPTKTSDLTNDSGFITDSYHDSTKQDTLVSGTNIKTINNETLLGSGNITISGGTATDVQINGTSITSSGTANIRTNGTYNSSTNKIATMSDIPSVPTKTSDLNNDSGFITNTVNNLTNYTLSSNLATVATTGSYTDLSNKPSIPSKTSDLNNDSGFITNTVNNLTNYTLSSNLSTVATTGSYTDLSNKPSIPTDSGWTAISNSSLEYRKFGNLYYIRGTVPYQSGGGTVTLPWTIPKAYVFMLAGGGNSYAKAYINANTNYLGYSQGTATSGSYNVNICFYID